MAKSVHPINQIGRSPELSFPLELEDIFEAAGAKVGDVYTYTTRYTVDRKEPGAVDRVTARIREELDPDEAERFIALMEQHGWDVSFLVDTY